MKGNILFKSVLLLNVNGIQEYSCLFNLIAAKPGAKLCIPLKFVFSWNLEILPCLYNVHAYSYFKVMHTIADTLYIKPIFASFDSSK